MCIFGKFLTACYSKGASQWPHWESLMGTHTGNSAWQLGDASREGRERHGRIGTQILALLSFGKEEASCAACVGSQRPPHSWLKMCPRRGSALRCDAKSISHRIHFSKHPVCQHKLHNVIHIRLEIHVYAHVSVYPVS